MPPSTPSKFKGTSTGGTATIDQALTSALQAARQALTTNHFDWKAVDIRGDYGGFAEKNITVEIEIIGH